MHELNPVISSKHSVHWSTSTIRSPVGPSGQVGSDLGARNQGTQWIKGTGNSSDFRPLVVYPIMAIEWENEVLNQSSGDPFFQTKTIWIH